MFQRSVLLCLIGSVALIPLLGCGPHGLAPRAPLRPLPPLPQTLLKNQEGLKPAGYYLFNQNQWRLLDRVRCRFDPRSQTAARLYRRGFSSAEVVQACVDLRRYAKDAPQELEAMAAYRRSGLPLASFGKFLTSGMSLTDYYNEERIGGRGLATVGWIFTGIGATALVGIGVAFLGAAIASGGCPDSYEGDCGEGSGLIAGLISLGLMGVAAATLLPGIPMAVIGELRKRSWLRGRLLDDGHVTDLDTFRLRYLDQAVRTPVRLSLTPLVSRGGGGLSLRLRW